MLTLNDGRTELWQWDTGRTLAVDADCSQVHFSNKVFGRSIDVDVVGGTAIIPDILLQADKDLNVWAFVGTAENGYTKISKTFTVNRRNKPADYVFTPTDQITLQTIQSQIGDLDDLTTEAKDTLVAAINEAARTGGGGGGSTIELDTTLTQSGKAADAKAVGDVTIRQAELGEDGVASFKNAAGIVLFTVDFSNLTPAVYGDMVISAEAVEIAEGGSGTFAVHLATAPTVNQPVYLAVSDNTRLSVSPSSLTFTPENYATPQTVTVTAAQDDDENDDTITVTLTSRKVDAKQLLVNIVDDDKPQLVTDGLVLHFDYSGTDRSSDIITDLAGGVTASGWSTTIPGANGVIGATKPITVDTSTEAWANFVAEMKGSTEGFTIEQFASCFGKTFNFTGRNNVADKAMVSNLMTYPGSGFNILTPAIYYKNQSNESVYASYSVDGVIRLSDGSTIAPNTSTVLLEKLPNWNNYAHTVIRFYPDGTCKRTINGCQYATDGVISDFASFDFDAMFSKFYILPSCDEIEKRWHKTQRIYNRILTEYEIKNNETVEASKLVLSTF